MPFPQDRTPSGPCSVAELYSVIVKARQLARDNNTEHIPALASVPGTLYRVEPAPPGNPKNDRRQIIREDCCCSII
jgi:hypothetical protein